MSGAVDLIRTEVEALGYDLTWSARVGTSPGGYEVYKVSLAARRQDTEDSRSPIDFSFGLLDSEKVLAPRGLGDAIYVQVSAGRPVAMYRSDYQRPTAIDLQVSERDELRNFPVRIGGALLELTDQKKLLLDGQPVETVRAGLDPVRPWSDYYPLMQFGGSGPITGGARERQDYVMRLPEFDRPGTAALLLCRYAWGANFSVAELDLGARRLTVSEPYNLPFAMGARISPGGWETFWRDVYSDPDKFELVHCWDRSQRAELPSFNASVVEDSGTQLNCWIRVKCRRGASGQLKLCVAALHEC